MTKSELNAADSRGSVRRGTTALQAALVSHTLLLDDTLSDLGYRAYAMLVTYAKMHGPKAIKGEQDEYYLYPGQKVMARDWGVNERTTLRAMNYLRGLHNDKCANFADKSLPCSCGEAYRYPLIETQYSGALGQAMLIKFLELDKDEESSVNGTIVYEAGEYRGFSLIPAAIVFNPGIPNGAVRLWAAVQKLGSGGETAYPKLETIARELSISVHTVENRLEVLREQAALHFMQRGLHQTLLYVFPSAEHICNLQWGAIVTGLRYYDLLRAGRISENGEGLARVIAEVLGVYRELLAAGRVSVGDTDAMMKAYSRLLLERKIDNGDVNLVQAIANEMLNEKVSGRAHGSLMTKPETQNPPIAETQRQPNAKSCKSDPPNIETQEPPKGENQYPPIAETQYPTENEAHSVNATKPETQNPTEVANKYVPISSVLLVGDQGIQNEDNANREELPAWISDLADMITQEFRDVNNQAGNRATLRGIHNQYKGQIPVCLLVAVGSFTSRLSFDQYTLAGVR